MYKVQVDSFTYMAKLGKKLFIHIFSHYISSPPTPTNTLTYEDSRMRMVEANVPIYGRVSELKIALGDRSC